MEVEILNKLSEHSHLFCNMCDKIRSLIKNIVAEHGGFYMFERYQPYTIIEAFDPIYTISQYCEARVYAIRIKDGDIYIYIDTTPDLIATKEYLLSEDAEENWYCFDWDSGFVFEHAINSIMVEMMVQ